MKPTPSQLIARASSRIAEVPSRTSAARALMTVSALADIDACELAEALVLTGITKLGRFDFARMPNDGAVIQAIRNDDPAAKEYFKVECRRRILGHVAALTHCSSVWVRAAQEHWDLQMYSDKKPNLVPLPDEERLDALTSLKRRDEITYWVKKMGHLSEAAWCLGVSSTWLSHKLKTHGMTPKPPTPAQRGVRVQPLRRANLFEASKVEKEAICNRMHELGTISAFAAECGISYKAARKQALIVGFKPRDPVRKVEDVESTLKKWIKETEYTGQTNGVGSTWLGLNVLLLASVGPSQSLKIKNAMKRLGFGSVRRTTQFDWVWVKNTCAVDPKSEAFRYRDDDRKKLSVWDLSKKKNAARQTVRNQLLEGKLQPTPELLEQAGLRIDND